MRIGAFDYIEKPPDLNNLLNSVRGALKSKSGSGKKLKNYYRECSFLVWML